VSFHFGGFVLDAAARELSQGGEHVRITPKALELLTYLVVHHRRAISKAELYEYLWPTTHVTDSNLPVLVHEVREALGDDPHEPRWVRTVARYGYAFCGDVGRSSSCEECSSGCRIEWRGQESVLQPGANVLGRHCEATVVIDDPRVSRCHAVIWVSDQGVIVEDAASRNGTFLHGERIDGPMSLEDGDELVLGGVVLTFRRCSPRGARLQGEPLEYELETRET